MHWPSTIISQNILWNIPGNLLTLSFGTSTGWATINLLELENENSTLAMGPLTKQQSSLVISFINVGGFAGNWLVLPLCGFFGVKRSIHLLGIPLVVRNIFWFIISNKKIPILQFHPVVRFDSNNLRAECVLPVCIQNFDWTCRRWYECFDLHANQWHIKYRVSYA